MVGDSVTITLGVVLVSLLLLLYLKLKKVYSFWSSRNIPGPKPLPIVGNILGMITGRQMQGQIYYDVYKEYPNEPVVGCYEALKPVLIVRDPEIVEKMLVKDFAHFIDHPFPYSDSMNPIDKSIFIMKGNLWRAVRNKLIPTFTSGKLKHMFAQIDGCSNKLVQEIEKHRQEPVELRKLLSDYTLDIIACTVFGIDLSEIRESDPMFRKMCYKAFEFGPIRVIQFLIQTASPTLADLFGMGFTPSDVTEYFTNLINETFKQRKVNNVKRNDFLDLLIQLKEKGTVDTPYRDAEDDYLTQNEGHFKTTDKIEFTSDMALAAAYMFLTAGFEGTSGAINFTLYYMAMNPEVQKKARDEVNAMLKKHGGYTYQALKEMEYLERVIKETQRIQPLVHLLFRECTKPYQLPNGTMLEVGAHVLIPTLGLHLDPNYHPDPDKFLPERFEENSPLQPPPGTYLPFGDGPRMCIGMRFAMVNMKIALAKALENYDIKISKKTILPLELETQGFLPVPKNPILFDLCKLT